VNGKHLCEQDSIKAQDFEEAIWEGWRKALTADLDANIERYRDEIAATVDAEEVKRLRANEERLVRKLREAIDKGLDADDPDEKKRYAERVADYKGQLALLRRRLASFTEEANAIEVDIPTIRRRVELGSRTKVRTERRAILVDWIERIEWDGIDAVITLKVPLMVANCKRGEPAASARSRASPRTGPARGPRSQPMAHGPPASHGKRASRRPEQYSRICARCRRRAPAAPRRSWEYSKAYRL
jgi:hypothetical protein